MSSQTATVNWCWHCRHQEKLVLAGTMNNKQHEIYNIYIYVCMYTHTCWYIRRASGPQPFRVLVQTLLYYNNKSFELCLWGMPRTTLQLSDHHNFSDQFSRALNIEEKHLQGRTWPPSGAQLLPKWSPNWAQMASKIDPEPDFHENLKTSIWAAICYTWGMSAMSKITHFRNPEPQENDQQNDVTKTRKNSVTEM